MSFNDKVERVGLVILSILACFHFGPRLVRKWKARPDAWAEVASQAFDVSAQAVGEQISFSQFASAVQTGPGTAPDPIAVTQFLQTAPEQIASLRKSFADAELAADLKVRHEKFLGLYRELQTFKSTPGLPPLFSIWEITSALEGLVKQMTDKAENVTASTLRTADAALLLLEELSRPGVPGDLVRNPPVRLLAVDDDPISRVAVTSSLKKIFNPPDVGTDGNSGFALAEKNPYDLIFLDIEMPGMDGYELCSKIHETKINGDTPVVFVTRHSDFNARAKSAKSGGQDLIAKPFLSFEITVKALTIVLRRRLERASVPAPAAQATNHSTQAAPAAAPVAADPKNVAATNTDVKAPVKENGVAVASAAASPNVSASAEPPKPAPPTDSAALPQVKRNQAPTFFAQAPTHIEAIRHQLQAFSYTAHETSGTDIFRNVNVSMLWLAAEAERAGLRAAARLSSTLQGLIKKLLENHKNVTPSALAAATRAVDLLEELCLGGKNPDLDNPAIRILVVDDDPIARRAMSGAIQLAFSKPDSADTGVEAVALSVDKPFDVIFLDIQMPGMDGFAACAKIRETTLNAQTPIIFVTSHSDVASREKATAAGGNGFIPKPVLAAEITLQALTFILRSRIEKKPTLEPQLAAVPAW